jgi:hypothetical protein
MIIRTPPKLTNRNSVVKYVEIDLWSWLKEFANGILKINFKENFQSFTVENVKIPAGQEISIPNQFRTAYPGTIPSGRIIIRQRLSDAVVIDGDNSWTENHVYLKNPSASDVIVTVLFFK